MRTKRLTYRRRSATARTSANDRTSPAQRAGLPDSTCPIRKAGASRINFAAGAQQPFASKPNREIKQTHDISVPTVQDNNTQRKTREAKTEDYEGTSRTTGHVFGWSDDQPKNDPSVDVPSPSSASHVFRWVLLSFTKRPVVAAATGFLGLDAPM